MQKMKAHRSTKTQILVLMIPLVMTISMIFFSTMTEARPIVDVMKPHTLCDYNNGGSLVNGGYFQGLSLEAVKQSRPSPGEVHQIITSTNH